MSSTNRGAERQPDDFYATPAASTRAILPHVVEPFMMLLLEPACGEGAILDVAREMHPGLRRYGFELDAVRADIARARGHEVLTGDSLARSAHDWTGADLIVMNPPFSLALPFVERAIGCVDTVAALLRLNFLGSAKRAPFHRAHPADVYVLPERPSFTKHLKWHTTRCALLVPSNDEKRKPARCEREASHPDVCMTIGTDSCEYAWFVWGPGRVGRVRVL